MTTMLLLDFLAALDRAGFDQRLALKAVRANKLRITGAGGLVYRAWVAANQPMWQDFAQRMTVGDPPRQVVQTIAIVGDQVTITFTDDADAVEWTLIYG